MEQAITVLLESSPMLGTLMFVFYTLYNKIDKLETELNKSNKEQDDRLTKLEVKVNEII